MAWERLMGDGRDGARYVRARNRQHWPMGWIRALPGGDRDSILRPVLLHALVRHVRHIAKRGRTAASAVRTPRAASRTVGGAILWAWAASAIRRYRLLHDLLPDLCIAKRRWRLPVRHGRKGG